MKEVTLIGDSIRMHYQEYVRAALGNSAHVWAPAENGRDSRNVLAHLQEWVLDRTPDIVHINCGLHDIKRPFDSTECAVPLHEYQENVREILSLIQRELPTAIVIWATTTPVNQVWHHLRKGFDRFEADVRAYNEAAVTVARSLRIPIDDLYTVVMAAGRDAYLMPDGVHFTDAGSAMLGQAVAEFIRGYL